jgi:hypothetical protein
LTEIIESLIIDKERYFPRFYCQFCPHKMLSIFRIKDSRICLFCFGVVKKNSGLNIDSIHDIDSKQVKKYLVSKDIPVKVKNLAAEIKPLSLSSLPIKEIKLENTTQFKISSDGSITESAPEPLTQENKLLNGPNRQSEKLPIIQAGLPRRRGRPKKVVG